MADLITDIESWLIDDCMSDIEDSPEDCDEAVEDLLGLTKMIDFRQELQ
jgi:hypothetical protein